MTEVRIEVHAGKVKVLRVDNDSALVQPDHAAYKLDVSADVILNWLELQTCGAGSDRWLVVPKRYAERTGIFMTGYATVITQMIQSPEEA